MPYILEPMKQEDIPEISRIERLCFSMPWPASAYRRELRTPDTNRYVVARYLTPAEAVSAGVPEPSSANLTSLSHPEVTPNGTAAAPQEHPEQGQPKSLLSALLPWLRPPSENGSTPAPTGRYPIVGYAGLWLMVDEAHVTTIGVHPDHRGHGAGELLFLGLIDIAWQMKASRVTLEVRVSNTGAQALYRKYGLEIAGLRRRYYSDNGEDAYIMWSEPIAAPSFKERVARLRESLAERMRRGFTRDLPAAHQVEPGRLQ
ncbi:MAG TPA: ribosomal protein S18-alanine N-acetyltransferase [Chloroflexia bacterium]|nr:ribosomal protein S18-alanine N-acetyltransferase [Chloroflexia bacterium]